MNRKIIKNIFTLLLTNTLLYCPFMSVNVLAEDVPSVLTEKVNENGTKDLVVVDIPTYIKNDSLKITDTEDYVLYTNNVKYNDTYGLIIAIQQFKKDVSSSSFLLEVENGVPISDVDVNLSSSINWYYNDFVESYEGGSVLHSPISMAKLTNVKQGGTFQYGVFYKLSEAKNISVNYKDNIEETKLNQLMENADKKEEFKNILLETIDTKDNKNIDINKQYSTQYKNLEDASKEEINNDDNSNQNVYSKTKTDSKVTNSKNIYKKLFPYLLGGTILVVCILLFLNRKLFFS